MRVGGTAEIKKKDKSIPVKSIVLIGADVENKFIAIKEIVYLISNDQEMITMRHDLLANLVIGEGFLELIERGDENVFANLAFWSQLNTIVHQCKYVVVYSVLLPKIQVETISENLISSIVDEMFWD